MDGEVGRWVAKLVERLPATAALWVRSIHLSKKKKMGDIIKEMTNTLRHKIKKFVLGVVINYMLIIITCGSYTVFKETLFSFERVGMHYPKEMQLLLGDKNERLNKDDMYSTPL
jgi:hypothetical protein